jgi:type II secretory pathway component PulJ
VGERGEISLPGLLVAMVIFMAVLGATLTTFEAFDSQAAGLTRRTDAQDAARRASDAIARELRNLASPTRDQPQAIDAAGPTDVVFQTVDATREAGSLNATNVKRVRYCLSAGEQRLYKQQQTWVTAARPAMPALGGCPSAAWGPATVASGQITNGTRRIFSYDSTTLTDISSMRVALYVDDDAAKAPPETLITTGVFLRNQNRRPVASFTATRTPQGILLNGSGSVDPEGQPLDYVWYDGTTKLDKCGAAAITCMYVPSAYGLAAPYDISLRVYDPAKLEAVAPVQVVP